MFYSYIIVGDKMSNDNYLWESLYKIVIIYKLWEIKYNICYEHIVRTNYKKQLIRKQMGFNIKELRNKKRRVYLSKNLKRHSCSIVIDWDNISNRDNISNKHVWQSWYSMLNKKYVHIFWK